MTKGLPRKWCEDEVISGGWEGWRDGVGGRLMCNQAGWGSGSGEGRGSGRGPRERVQGLRVRVQGVRGGSKMSGGGSRVSGEGPRCLGEGPGSQGRVRVSGEGPGCPGEGPGSQGRVQDVRGRVQCLRGVQGVKGVQVIVRRFRVARWDWGYSHMGDESS